MVAQQLRFEFTGDRPSRSNGETRGEEGSVCQVRAASEKTEPLENVVMEEVLRSQNLTKALKRVRLNKGSPGIDGMTVDELDKELERRGHVFCRYADDCNIYVRSERAGKPVMDSVERFLAKKLKLKVNRQKSAVAKPQERKFLGFSFTSGKELKITLSDKALKGVKYQVKKITRRSRGISLLQVIKELSGYLQGWLGYFRLLETPTVLKALDSWIRHRLRCFVMKQWIKNCHTRYKGLQGLGVNEWNSRPVAVSRKGPWAMSNMKPVKMAMPNLFFAERGLLSLFNQYESLAKTI